MAIDWQKPIQTTTGLKAKLLTPEPVKFANGCTRVVLLECGDGTVMVWHFREDGTCHDYMLFNVPEPAVQEREVLNADALVRELKTLSSWNWKSTIENRIAPEREAAAKRIAELERQLQEIYSAPAGCSCGAKELSAKVSSLSEANEYLQRQVSLRDAMIERSKGGLTWSDTKPDKPGWWWTTAGKSPVRVFLQDGNLVVGDCSLSLPINQVESKWAGPIPEPAEPGEAEKPAPFEACGLLASYAEAICKNSPDSEAAKAIYRQMDGETQELAKLSDQVWRALRGADKPTAEKLPRRFRWKNKDGTTGFGIEEVGGHRIGANWIEAGREPVFGYEIDFID